MSKMTFAEYREVQNTYFRSLDVPHVTPEELKANIDNWLERSRPRGRVG